MFPHELLMFSFYIGGQVLFKQATTCCPEWFAVLRLRTRFESKRRMLKVTSVCVILPEATGQKELTSRLLLIHRLVIVKHVESLTQNTWS